MEKKGNEQIKEIIKRFSEKKVLLIGDSILDIYVYGTAIGKSLETPTIVAKENSIVHSFGGASLVARNILELGGVVSFISVIGDDEESRHYNEFNHENLRKLFIVDVSRKTTIKKRFWIDGYKLLQIDNLDDRDIDEKILEKVLAEVRKEITNCDIVVISDYRHGMMTKELIFTIKKMCVDNKKPMFADSQISHREGNHETYRDSYMVLLSEKEANSLDYRNEILNLKKVLGTSNICIKLGEKGSVCLIDEKTIRTPALKISAVDTCGAGDAFLAALCLCNMNYPEDSLKIANCWAGLSTLVHGTSPPKKTELLKELIG